MAKRTNPKLIGGFVVGAIVLLIIGILTFGGSQYFATKAKAVLFFRDQSLGGLDIGSPVTFRGVKIGTVTGIAIQYDVIKSTMQIPVHIEINTDQIEIVSGQRSVHNLKTLVERGLRGQLVVQSLVTGQASIDFDFHPNSPLIIVGTEPNTPELPTIPSEMAILKATLSDTLAKINKLPLEEISAQILNTVKSANDALSNVKAAAKSADALLNNVNEQVKPLSDSFLGASKQADLTLKEAKDVFVDSRKLVNNIDSNLPQLLVSANETLATLNQAVEQAQSTLKVAQSSISPSSPLYFELNRTLRELQAAAAAIRVFAEFIQRNPSALLTGKQ